MGFYCILFFFKSEICKQYLLRLQVGIAPTISLNLDLIRETECKEWLQTLNFNKWLDNKRYPKLICNITGLSIEDGCCQRSSNWESSSYQLLGHVGQQMLENCNSWNIHIDFHSHFLSQRHTPATNITESLLFQAYEHNVQVDLPVYIKKCIDKLRVLEERVFNCQY